jgi:hypothetical protein
VSESDRLSKGFVNWQGQRVFVPWFGAPRIVPTTDSEVRVLKVRFRLDIAIAMAIIPFCAIGVWLGNPWGFVAAVLAVSIVVGSGVLLQHRHVRQWPRLMMVKFARLRFMLGYFRSLRIMERVNAIGWGGLGLLYGLPLFLLTIEKLIETPGDGWFVARLAVALLGPGLWTFLAARHATLALLSLLPERRTRPVEGSSYGA